MIGNVKGIPRRLYVWLAEFVAKRWDGIVLLWTALFTAERVLIYAIHGF